MESEERAKLSSSARNSLPDSDFAFIENGGHKDQSGRTMPRSLRHYPVHDAAHARAALARIAQGKKFAAEAAPKVHAQAKKFGITMHNEPDTRDYTWYDEEYREACAAEEAQTPASGSEFLILPERRFVAARPEVRSYDDGPSTIYGYASSFNKLSRKLGGFVERVMPTAFEEARKAGYPSVVCRYNHKDEYLLGTSDAGTLKLNTDDTGLAYDVLPPASRADVLEYVQRGDVRYSSFAFRCNSDEGGDEWGLSDFDYPMRSLHNVELVDVAPVLDPAYHDTMAAARNIAGAIESLAKFKNADPAEVRSLLDAGQGKKLFKRTDRSSETAAADEVEARAAAEAEEQRAAAEIARVNDMRMKQLELKMRKPF